MNRTQIYLPKELRQEIDKQRRQSGESLANYIRKAARERIKREKNKKVELKKLAEYVTSGVEKSGWEGLNVLKWQKEIRKDRKII